MIARVIPIAGSLLTVEVVMKTCLRFVIGGGIIATSWFAPAWASYWLHLIGTVFLMFAVYQIVGNVEGKVMAHAVSWIMVRRAQWREQHLRSVACRKCGCSSCPYDGAAR